MPRRNTPRLEGLSEDTPRFLEVLEEGPEFVQIVGTAYHRWRAWVIRFDHLHSFRDSSDYRDWVEADERFHESFRSHLNTPQLDEVKQKVSRFHEEQRESGFPLHLPPPLAGYSGPYYAKPFTPETLIAAVTALAWAI
jgi:hypothetical protein